MALVDSPAASPLVYSDYPPYPAEWSRLENAAYQFSAPARALVRQARSRTTASWPALRLAGGKPDLGYLNGCRALANDVADAAIAEHLRGEDAAAVESVRDLLHLADLLDDNSPSMIRVMVALGVRLIGVNRLAVITSDVALTNDPADAKRLQITAAKALIRQLFSVRDPAEQFGDLIRREAAAGRINTAQRDRFVTQLDRGQMECNLAAMSLACHLFRIDKGRWPASLQEFIGYLPGQPRDAWGAMGYIVVKLGQPQAVDRPLVYSRCDAKDGLFYPTNEPQFSYYPGFQSGNQRKQGGQFRDVTLWHPLHPNAPPTTRPLREGP